MPNYLIEEVVTYTLQADSEMEAESKFLSASSEELNTVFFNAVLERTITELDEDGNT